jgi:ABC-2 family transporter protein
MLSRLSCLSISAVEDRCHTVASFATTTPRVVSILTPPTSLSCHWSFFSGLSGFTGYRSCSPLCSGSNFQRDVATQIQLVLMYLAASMPFVFALVTMVAEKEHGYRGYLRIFGLKDSVYWSITFLEQVFFVILPVLLMLALAYAIPASSYFANSNVGVNFVIFLTYGLCMNAFASMIGSMVSNQKGRRGWRRRRRKDGEGWRTEEQVEGRTT